MKAWDYELVAYDGDYWCAHHTPEHECLDEDCEECAPVFASNADGSEACSECGIDAWGNYPPKSEVE